VAHLAVRADDAGERRGALGTAGGRSRRSRDGRRLVGCGWHGLDGSIRKDEKQSERGERDGNRIHAGLTLLYTVGAAVRGPHKPFARPGFCLKLKES